MKNDVNKKLTASVLKAAMKQKNVCPLKDTILVHGDTGRPDLEMSPEDFEEFQKKENERKRDFSRILIKSPFEQYSENIYQELSQIKSSNVEFVEESRRKEALAYFKKHIEIATALLICKTDTAGIGINNAKQRCKLSPYLKKEIEIVFESEYEDAKLDYSPMTYDEGKEILENNLCGDTHDFIDDYWEEYALENDLSEEEMSGGYSYDDIDDDMIEYYISCASLKREITVEQIQETLERLKEGANANQRKGAPRTNEKPYSALLVFIKYGCKKTHKHLEYVYECLDLFGFIEDLIKSGWTETNKYPKIQYMKSLFDECMRYKLVINPEIPF